VPIEWTEEDEARAQVAAEPGSERESIVTH
jgi:hypothetical protein